MLTASSAAAGLCSRLRVRRRQRLLSVPNVASTRQRSGSGLKPFASAPRVRPRRAQGICAGQTEVVTWTVHAVLRCCLCDTWADIDAINLDALDGPAVPGRAVQERAHGLRVMRVGRCHQNSQYKAQRAGQHMALDAAYLLVAVHPARACLRAGHDALAVQDGGRRLRRSTLLLAHRPHQQGGDVGPVAPCAPRRRSGSDRAKFVWSARSERNRRGSLHRCRSVRRGRADQPCPAARRTVPMT